MDIIPHISSELVDYLSRIYPDHAPEPDLSDRDIWINRGAVGVVRHLKTVLAEQGENILTQQLTKEN